MKRPCPLKSYLFSLGVGREPIRHHPPKTLEEHSVLSLFSLCILVRTPRAITSASDPRFLGLGENRIYFVSLPTHLACGGQTGFLVLQLERSKAVHMQSVLCEPVSTPPWPFHLSAMCFPECLASAEK